MELHSKNIKQLSTSDIYILLKKDIEDICLKYKFLNLNEEDKALIEIRYGSDLKNPSPTPEWSKDYGAKYYGSLVPKMKRILKNPSGQIRRRKRNTKAVLPEKMEEVVPTKCEISPQENPESVISPKEDVLPQRRDNNDQFTKDNCIEMLELLKTAKFNQLVSKLTTKEAVIISLRLGYVDDKYFSVGSIAKFLGIDEEFLKEATKKVLLVYKDNLNELIDNAIDVMAPSNSVGFQKRK